MDAETGETTREKATPAGHNQIGAPRHRWTDQLVLVGTAGRAGQRTPGFPGQAMIL